MQMNFDKSQQSEFPRHSIATPSEAYMYPSASVKYCESQELPTPSYHSREAVGYNLGGREALKISPALKVLLRCLRYAPIFPSVPLKIELSVRMLASCINPIPFATPSGPVCRSDRPRIGRNSSCSTDLRGCLYTDSSVSVFLRSSSLEDFHGGILQHWGSICPVRHWRLVH